MAATAVGARPMPKSAALEPRACEYVMPRERAYGQTRCLNVGRSRVSVVVKGKPRRGFSSDPAAHRRYGQRSCMRGAR